MCLEIRSEICQRQVKAHGLKMCPAFVGSAPSYAFPSILWRREENSQRSLEAGVSYTSVEATQC